MTDFGFTLSKSSTIDLDSIDHSAYDRLCRQVPTARNCMSCGSCSATCTAAPFSGMSLRKLLLYLQRGKEIDALLANCMLCGKCSMVCPRGINTRQIILTISRNHD